MRYSASLGRKERRRKKREEQKQKFGICCFLICSVSGRAMQDLAYWNWTWVVISPLPITNTQRAHTPCAGTVMRGPCITINLEALLRSFFRLLTTYRLLFFASSTCQVYNEPLDVSLMCIQPKNWWTNRQTNRQTDKQTDPQTKHSTPAAHARARGN